MKIKTVALVTLALTHSYVFAYYEKNGSQDNGKNNYFMTRFDTNGDKQVTKEEFLASAADRFKSMDVNGDKEITLKEFLERYADFQGKQTQSPGGIRSDSGLHFKENDANNDGAINQTEYMKAAEQHAAEMFSKKDRNGDKQLSKEEFTSMQHNQTQQEKPPSAPVPEKVFAKLDANGDKKVTETEYNDSRNKWFVELDKNNDGKITAEEAS